MDGPGGNLPRKRAGDSNSPYQPSPIKDWQRNTWNGPAPLDSNPFDEPDEAPELLELRSDNVKQKSGEFWQEQKEQTGYVSAALSSRRKRTGAGKRNNPQNPKLSTLVLKAAAIVFVLGLATVAVLFFAVYRVRDIQVVGANQIDANDIKKISGIHIGDSMLTLDEKKVSEAMLSGSRTWAKETNNQTYYRLQFRYIEQQMPGTVIIYVREREPCCWMDLRGISYVLDKKRTVLWETEDEEEKQLLIESNLVKVTGLKVKSGSQAGMTMELESTVQQRVFEDLFLEMKVLGCTDMIKEVDLSKADREKDPSVLIETRAGFTVSLGDCRSSDPDVNQIHAKLRSMLLVQEKLIQLDKHEGTIDVKVPEQPYYAPSSTK